MQLRRKTLKDATPQLSRKALTRTRKEGGNGSLHQMGKRGEDMGNLCLIIRGRCNFCVTSQQLTNMIVLFIVIIIGHESLTPVSFIGKAWKVSHTLILDFLFSSPKISVCVVHAFIWYVIVVKTECIISSGKEFLEGRKLVQ
jgi:hypothetical protein